MNFIKLLFCIALFPLMLYAEKDTVEFTVSMPPNPMATPAPSDKVAPQDEQSSKISELKLLAVSQWLQGHLGERFPQFQKFVTADFAERYVRDYKVGKSQDGSMEISGHIDAKSLAGWVNLMDTKAHGPTKLKVIYATSSSVPAISFEASETSGRGRETLYGQISGGLISQQFKSYNTAPAPVGSNFPMSRPPLQKNDISTLSRFASQTGNNVVFWTHLSPCQPCGGMRLDFFFYNALGDRLVAISSEDLKVSPNEVNNNDRLSTALNEAYQTFHKEIEDAVTSGKIFAEEYHFRIEGIENYRAYKLIDQELGRQDQVNDLVIRKAANHTAEFSFLSTQSVDDLAQRFQQMDFGSFRLKLLRVDSRTLVMRYLG